MRRTPAAAPDRTAEHRPDPGTLRSRRRFARRQWARRWLTWKYVVAVLALLAVVAVAGWLVLFSSWLSVKAVQVEGARQVRPHEIRAAAAVPRGEALARLDLDRIRSRVEALAPIRSAEVTREWPDTVRITVVERRVVAVVSVAGQLRGIDADGVLFKDYADPPADLPRIETGADTGSDALREAARVVAALPADLASKVDHVQVDTIDQISLLLRDGREVRWGSSDDSATKAKVLATMLAHLPGHQRYDVSVPGQPTTTG